MTIQLVTFGFGAGLLLIGIVGGGLELRELKIPQVGRAARTLATMLGLVFILVGVGMEHGSLTALVQALTQGDAGDGDAELDGINEGDDDRQAQPDRRLQTPAAERENRQVLIRNRSSRIIRHFYASNIDRKQWEEDILGEDVLRPGAEIPIDIDDGTGHCRYDLRAVFSDGTDVVNRQVNVCTTESWTIH